MHVLRASRARRGHHARSACGRAPMCSGCTTPARRSSASRCRTSTSGCMARPTRSSTAPICTTSWRDRAREFKADVVRLNHRVVGFTEDADGVELNFADGTSARGDLLIGADGLEVGGAPPDRRRGAGDLHRRRRLAHHRADRTPADEFPRTGHVGVHGAGRPRRLLLSARRRAVEFRRHRRDRRRLARSRGPSSCRGSSSRPTIVGWHPVIQTIIDTADKDTVLSLVAVQPAADPRLEHRARRRSSATPRIRRCLISRRAR